MSFSLALWIMRGYLMKISLCILKSWLKNTKKKKNSNLQKAIDEIMRESKESSKYKQRENFETRSEDASPKYKDQSFASSSSSSKNKSPHSNSVSKKVKKSLSAKKKKHIPPKRKRSYSSDASESGKKLSTPLRKRRHSSDASDSGSYVFPKRMIYDDAYANLIANIPPNIDYNGDSNYLTTHSTGLLSRNYKERPQTPTLDLLHKSDSLKEKKIVPTPKKIGFLGLGKLGQGIVKNLKLSGHSVTVWNRTTEKCKPFADQLGVEVVKTPADVVVASDITFCCVSDADAAKTLVFGNCGILQGLELSSGQDKSYVEMTSMDPETSQTFAEEIKLKGGRYLEAPLSGSRVEANEGTLFILAAGDQSLYEDCKSCLDAASKKHIFISPEVGTASKFNLIHSTLVGTVYAAVAESLALVSRTGLKGEDFLEVLKYGVLHSEDVINKGMSMIKSDYVSNTSLKHMQKDLDLGLKLGNSVEQPTPIIAQANEVYKHCKLLRYGDHDVSAVFEGTRP